MNSQRGLTFLFKRLSCLGHTKKNTVLLSEEGNKFGSENYDDFKLYAKLLIILLVPFVFMLPEV
ncbi:CLUMA_CG000496, isoform A [Clunio marinus]|uniref:CLUMA_CG000496, isoform A n=1 Tax=Clunio marinus TaxID=568069 RepID=A0A1J1HGX2_9DIPT|nr:CLUMA_CG000496, isoform A [Clunio marinus]